MDLGLVRKGVNPLLVAYAHIGIVERVMLALVDDPDDFGPPEVVVRELMRMSWDGLRAPGAPAMPVPPD
jgi:hypothetical protein